MVQPFYEPRSSTNWSSFMKLSRISSSFENFSVCEYLIKFSKTEHQMALQFLKPFYLSNTD